MSGLNDEELLALRMITVAGGGNGVIVEQCHQKLNQISRKWRRNGFKVIEGLITRGLVFTRRDGYRQVYFVPDDLRKVLSDFFLSAIFQRTSIDPERFSPRYRFDFAAPLRHICLLLSYVRKHDVRITQSGSLFKKFQDDLVVIIEEDERSLEESFFPVRYPPRLAFCCFLQSPIVCASKETAPLAGLRLRTGWQPRILNGGKILQLLEADIYRTRLGPPDAVVVDREVPRDTVLSISALLEEMHALSTTHSSHGLSLRVEKNLVDMLEYLGAFEVCESRNDTMIRMTETGKALFGLAILARRKV